MRCPGSFQSARQQSRHRHHTTRVAPMNAQTSHSLPASPPSHLTKWLKYYEGGMLPWDSYAAASQLMFYCTHPNPLQLTEQPDCSLATATDASDTLATAWTVRRSAGVVQVQAAGSPGQGPTQMCVDKLRPRHGGWCLELGCGTGSSSVFLASLGMRVVGVDAAAAAIKAARDSALQQGVQPPTSASCTSTTPLALGNRSGETSPGAAGSTCTGSAWFLQHDIFTLPRPFTPTTAMHIAQQQLSGSTFDDSPPPSAFDFIYDCQSFHVLRQVDEAAYLELLRTALAPGGYLMLLAGAVDDATTDAPQPQVPQPGSASEPGHGTQNNAAEVGVGLAAAAGALAGGCVDSAHVTRDSNDLPASSATTLKPLGPPQMTEAQLKAAFSEPDWEWVWLVKTRFDPTEYYVKTFPEPPLAWWGLLRRRA